MGTTGGLQGASPAVERCKGKNQAGHGGIRVGGGEGSEVFGGGGGAGGGGAIKERVREREAGRPID